MDNRSILKRKVAHFGTIAFNYSVFGVALILLALLSTVIIALLTVLGIFAVFIYYLLLIITAICTVGILFLADEYRGLWSKGIDYMETAGNIGSYSNTHIVPFLIEAIPVATIIVLILSVVAFICMMFDRKWEKAKNRLIFMGIVIVLLVLLIIALLVGIITIGG